MAAPRTLRALRRYNRPPLGRHRCLLQTGKQSLAWLRRRPQQQNPRLPATRLRPARRRISPPQGSNMHASAAMIPQNRPLDSLKTLFYVMLSIATFSRKGCGCANVLPTVASISYISKDSIPMSVSVYQASAPIFVQFLTSLSTVLDKAAAHAEAKKIDPAVLLNTRLYPDMFPLARQVREATNHAASACGHVAGADRWHGGQRNHVQIPQRRRAQIHRTSIVAELLPTELLFSSHDRLRHFAQLRRRSRQTRLYGHAGHAVSRNGAESGRVGYLISLPMRSIIGLGVA